MYDIYCKLRDRKGLTDYQVSNATGIPRSTFSIKSGCPEGQPIEKEGRKNEETKDITLLNALKLCSFREITKMISSSFQK